MSLQDSLFFEDVEDDVIIFTKNRTRKRALVFPPVNNYRRYIIHQLVQERFSDLLHTFSIGQGSARRTVVCYKSDVKRDSKLNISEWKKNPMTKQTNIACEMGIEDRQSFSKSSECAQLQRQVKSVPAVEIYRPPPARRANNCSWTSGTEIQISSTEDSSSVKSARQKRPDRAVYIPRHRRSLEAGEKRSRNIKTHINHDVLNKDPNTNNNCRLQDVCCIQQDVGSSSSNDKTLETYNMEIEDNQFPQESFENVLSSDSGETSNHMTYDDIEYMHELSEELKDVPISEEKEDVTINTISEDNTDFNLVKPSDEVGVNKQIEVTDKQIRTMQLTEKENRAVKEHLNINDVINHKNRQPIQQNVVSNVLIISDTVQKESKPSTQVPAILTLPEKRVKKIERQKSKPALPPSPPMKVNRDECEWDSLFDDNGDCLDPTLIEELTSAVGEVMIQQPKNDYKTYSKQVQVSSDEFAHVVEIYNFPSEFKESDLVAVFSPFSNGGFQLKWVDDTHCLGVFSSPLIAAEVLASDHPFVKTRPLSEASTLSKTKARRSAEFLQPYRNRPETCAALARRLVTGALGVKLATARQEREHEKNVLREAKEKRRLANKQREDVWEGIIPEK